MINSDHATFFSLILFGIGILGLLTRKNLIMILISVEIMLNAVNLNLIALSRRDIQGMTAGGGEAIALFVILLAACEAAVGLGILIGLKKYSSDVSVDDFDELRD